MFLNNCIVEYLMTNIEYLWGIMLLLWHNPKSLNMNGKEKLICGDHSPPKNTHIGYYRSYKIFRQCLITPQIDCKTSRRRSLWTTNTSNTNNLTKSTFISRTFFHFFQKSFTQTNLVTRKHTPFQKYFSVLE